MAKILIVDDKESNLLVLQNMLKSLDVEIIKATSGDDALRASLNHDFALAVLDVQMPAMDGYELADLLRNDQRTRHLPIIFLSAIYSDAPHVFRGYASGGVDFITKPFSPDILMSKVRVFLALDEQKTELLRQKARLEALVMQLNEQIEARREAEALLRETNENLEQTVSARTAELVKMVEALQQKTRELENQTLLLKETNTAMKVLLEQREKDRRELEEKVLINLDQLIRPHLAALAAGKLSPRQHALLDAINRSLDEIAVPLSRRFSIDNRRLTPTETRVADLVRQGWSTKQITEIMGVEKSTIDYHRRNLRLKFGLIHQGVNLQSYLKSLEYGARDANRGIIPLLNPYFFLLDLSPAMRDCPIVM